MKATLQEDYGHSLEDGYNRAVTDAWDRAQEYVCIFKNFKLYLFYNNNTWLQIGHEVILLDG